MAYPLSGELSFATVTAKLAEMEPFLKVSSGPLELNLSGVTRVDSAGLALLLELNRLAQNRGRTLRFVHVPLRLREMAEFFDLTGQLTLAG